MMLLNWDTEFTYVIRFGKLISGHEIGKGQFSITPKVGKAKECSSKHALLLLSRVSWVKHKILQEYVN